MIFPRNYAEPLHWLNACCGKLFLIDNVAKRRFDANTNSGSTFWIFIPRKRNFKLNTMGCHTLTPKVIGKDRLRIEWLIRQGFEVIRFTSNEIQSATPRVLFGIDAAIKGRLEQDSPPHPPTPSPPEEEKGR